MDSAGVGKCAIVSMLFFAFRFVMKEYNWLGRMLQKWIQWWYYFSARMTLTNTAPEPAAEGALKKFANAKAISSDQYFGGPQIDVCFDM